LGFQVDDEHADLPAAAARLLSRQLHDDTGVFAARARHAHAGRVIEHPRDAGAGSGEHVDAWPSFAWSCATLSLRCSHSSTSSRLTSTISPSEVTFRNSRSDWLLDTLRYASSYRPCSTEK